ncbi:MAG: peptide chain release factor N(5)-glutamine methyltransferase, partial [Agathobacter sp.]|nr:peptide chain release factor N(5)-glutamine methyltransferase [Agathobacter sp.]
QALDGKEDGLHFYRRIVKDALKHLKPEGMLLFEIGHDQGEAVSELMREAGYKDVRVVEDLAGNDRVVIGGL